MSRGRANLLSWAAIVLIAALIVWLRPVLREASYEAGLRETAGIRPMPVGEFLGTAFIGGFRAVAVDVAWVRAMRLQQEQKWYELLALYNLIANLQPRLEQVWIFNGWNMMFNISNAVEDNETAWAWVQRGLEFLTRGCERNPKSWHLRTTLAQVYFTRCGSINDERTQYYARRLQEETGRSGWEWSILWTERALKVSEEVPTFSRNYVPVAYREMAREAVARGDLAQMRFYREKAIAEWRRILESFPDYEPAMNYIQDAEARLRAYDLAEKAGTLLRQNNGRGWLQPAGEITTIWEQLLAVDRWDEETIHQLKEWATAYAAQAARLREAGLAAEAEQCERQSHRLWHLLAEKTDDEEAARRIKE